MNNTPLYSPASSAPHLKEKIEEMRSLIPQLREAARSYYQDNQEIMSNQEYDLLYDRLQRLEEETGTILSGSPTQEVGYEAAESLEKEAHPSPMLSLNKTKDREELRAFIGAQKALLSWKLDGLTVVLTYEGGSLVKAVTRGNGVIGEIVTANARTFRNLPLSIPYQGRLILRGEAIITYSDFEKINQAIPEVEARYKNPRNLCSGSVRQLDSRITAERCVRFVAFALVSCEGVSFDNSREKEFAWLSSQGFEVVEHRAVTADTLDEVMDDFEQKITSNDFPSDGLVIIYDDIAYGQSLGETSKFPRNAMAFKWADDLVKTRLIAIEWSPSRTGLINPVAIFEPVELEGTTVKRASVHNVSIVRELALGEGDEITVYKANMIIPQIAENLTRSGHIRVPDTCPACGEKTVIKSENGIETLTCPNPACPAKRIKAFGLFASRDALNIEGLSEATFEKLIGRGLIKEYSDIFRLKDYRNEIVSLEGFGDKSFERLLASIEKARHTTASRLLYALGIPNVGSANAKLISRHYGGDICLIRKATCEELSAIDDIGPVIAGSITAYFSGKENMEQLDRLLPYLTLEKEETAGELPLAGKTFVITGAVHHFANRSELKSRIEELGGKVAGSVSQKTAYLINNDTTSASVKNQAAQKLGIPILSEEDFLGLIGEDKA